MTETTSTRPPSVDRVLSSSAGKALVERYGHASVTNAIRQQIALQKSELNKSRDLREFPDVTALIGLVSDALAAQDVFSLKRVLNLTGTVLHTNLGRAALPASALASIQKIGAGASNLEYDLASGRRGDRDSHVESLIVELTGAEAATVVNNNAAAVMLALNTLALDREVPVSRGELVEIGGSFRIPDIMARSGCRLIEVGATNRTHLADYRNAITPATALLLKVHTSNYEIQGFTSSVPGSEVAALAREHQLPMMTDLGSGNLIDLARLGLPSEPTVADTLESGADVVTFSGDKLLGGPQAGLIVGKREFIEDIKQNPMKRALRVDKLTIAALYEVLKLYRNPERLVQALPTLRHLTRPAAEIRQIADQMASTLARRLAPHARVEVVELSSQIGSGSLPLKMLSGHGVEIRPVTGEDQQLRALARAFRSLPIPVIGRIQDGGLLLDPRTLDDVAEFEAQLDQLQPVGPT
ncbi:MAG: L-seryl-tRNA(Sec) selenium transferase [Proteobacteria bacterium]|nr:L-seryl-tRNA(Sec) selenium transferase [Pseudomonadota bacterium]